MDNFDLGMSLLRDVGDTYHLEEIDLLGMIRVSRWPPGCDERMYNMYFTFIYS